MSLITTGTVSLTQNSNIVTGVGTTFLDSNVEAGDLFKIDGQVVPFIIAANATNNLSLTLLSPYPLPDVSGVTFQVTTDFYDFQIPKISPSMRDSYYFINEGLRIIAEQLGLVGASAYHAQIVTKTSIGVPVQGAYFGYQKFTGQAQLNKLILSTNDDATENDLVLDIEINGALQGINLTVPAGQKSAESSALTSVVAAGQVLRFKWITVNEPAGSNWNVDIHYQNSSGLIIYYDFQKMYIGTLYTGLILGSAYKPPNRSKLFGINYELDEAPIGSGIILELLKDGASLSPSVTVTIPENSFTGYLEFSQTEILTTQTVSLQVNQPGSVVPGGNLKVTLHSYHTT